MYRVGEVIRQARQHRGWGQRRLAQVSGVSQPNIAAIESGTRAPSLAMVARLVRACGLQLRYELEPRHADVDTEIAALWERQPESRARGAGLDALITAARLAAKGMRLVLDGPLAARVCGAPVTINAVDRIWCHHADLDQLREATRRSHLDLRPLRPRYDEDGEQILADGDEVRIGQCQVTLGIPPAARWMLRVFGGSLLVVGMEQLLAYPHWAPADRVAVSRLATTVAERGNGIHGLDPAG